MKPIINPLWFYLIGMSEGLIGAGYALGTLGILATIIMAIVCALEQDMSHPNEKLISFLKRNSKKCFVIGLIGILISTFTPSEKTCYQMMAASMVTPNNVEAVVDTTKDGVEWLIDTITEASEKLTDNKVESVDE